MGHAGDPIEPNPAEHVRFAPELDPRVQGIEVAVSPRGHEVEPYGTVSTEDRRPLADRVVRAPRPSRTVRNALFVVDVPGPTRAERLA
jgi:hypothetical protein